MYGLRLGIPSQMGCSVTLSSWSFRFYIIPQKKKRKKKEHGNGAEFGSRPWKASLSQAEELKKSTKLPHATNKLNAVLTPVVWALLPTNIG